MIKKWIVMAHRTSGSVLGAANSPCKTENGKVLEFETKGAADAYKNQLNEGCRSGNVFYTTEPYVAN